MHRFRDIVISETALKGQSRSSVRSFFVRPPVLSIRDGQSRLQWFSGTLHSRNDLEIKGNWRWCN